MLHVSLATLHHRISEQTITHLFCALPLLVDSGNDDNVPSHFVTKPQLCKYQYDAPIYTYPTRQLTPTQKCSAVGQFSHVTLSRDQLW